MAIEIAPDVLVETWNNEVSDLASHTLIEPGSLVFQAASVMKAGQLVAFSGTFFPGSGGDCLSEGSLTLDGKLESPEFIFRFSNVSAYDPARHSATTLPGPQPGAEPAQDEPVEAPAQAVAMPRELWGTWSIVHDLNVQGTSTCDQAFFSSMIGTQIEYSPQVFRWKDTVVSQPNVQVEVISPEKLTKDYRISFEQLGVSVSSADRITIKHPDTSVTGATTEIPGDVVFLKNPTSIIFPLCGMWFEAELNTPPAQN